MKSFIKISIVLFVLIFGSNVAFAQTTDGGDSTGGDNSTPDAKLYIKDGDYWDGLVVDGTGFKHGIEMAEAGTAYIVNSKVTNTGTDFVTPDGRHGNGRGIVVSHSGATLYVINTESSGNSEDGFRSRNGGLMVITGSKAFDNDKIGFFAGDGGHMTVAGSQGYNNLYGFLAGNDFGEIDISTSQFYNNANQGIQLHGGEDVEMSATLVYGNNTSETKDADSGGISIMGVKKISVKDTKVTDNYHMGIYIESDTAYSDPPVRVTLDNVVVRSFNMTAIVSKGDSVVTIINSSLNGKCLEHADKISGTVGIITVDGNAIVSGQECP